MHDTNANEDADENSHSRNISKKRSHTTHEATKEMIKREV